MPVEQDFDNMCRCNFCNNKITPLTAKLQDTPSSVRWEKFGLCCVSCTASDSFVKKRTKTYNTIISADSLIVDKNITDDRYLKSVNSINYEPHIRKQPYSSSKVQSQRMIIAGNCISALGIVAVILLVYTKYNELALLGLFPIIIGLIICRWGAWRVSGSHSLMFRRSKS